MIEELQARFLPPFLASARIRIDHVRGIVERREHGALVGALRDLHALVGEAGLLGLGAVITLARQTERAAHQLVETRSDADALALTATLDELGKGLDLVTPTTTGGKSP